MIKGERQRGRGRGRGGDLERDLEKKKKEKRWEIGKKEAKCQSLSQIQPGNCNSELGSASYIA